jgi:hypothetical protein
VRALLLATLALWGLLLAGCGGGTLAVGGTRVLHLALSEYRIRPSAATAPAGRLTLRVRNFGRLSHDLAIIGDGRTLASTQPLPPGAEATLTVSLAPGSYMLQSTLDSDATLGATATLRVR